MSEYGVVGPAKGLIVSGAGAAWPGKRKGVQTAMRMMKQCRSALLSWFLVPPSRVVLVAAHYHSSCSRALLDCGQCCDIQPALRIMYEK